MHWVLALSLGIAWYWLLGIGDWLLAVAIGYWLLAVHCALATIGYWLLVVVMAARARSTGPEPKIWDMGGFTC
jgi:hypothetical protein